MFSGQAYSTLNGNQKNCQQNKCCAVKNIYSSKLMEDLRHCCWRCLNKSQSSQEGRDTFYIM